jgi:ABC-type transport system involved in multi-copper enzyme maturation permease subunit
MNAVGRALWNPIVAKEYRSRMRTWRSPTAMTVYIVLLGGLGWAVFSAISYGGPLGVLGAGTNYGQWLFTFLILFQVTLLAFITPALTAGAISGERERQTLDLLFVTPLPPFSIVWGKLLASMSFVVLLLILSIPIFSLVFLFGGIELDQMLYGFLVTGVTALTLGLMGLAFSTLFRRTLVATVVSYGAAFLLLVGSLGYGLLFPTVADPQQTTVPAPPAVTVLSPLMPLVVIATNQQLSGWFVRYESSSPGAYIKGGSCVGAPDGGVTCYGGGGTTLPVMSVVPSTGNQSTTAMKDGLFKDWEYWQANVVMQLVICALALAFSAFVIPPVRRYRLRRRKEPAAL